MKRVIVVALACWLMAATGMAQAGPLLWIDDVNGNIGTVDVQTGAVSLIGNPDSGITLTDIAFDPSGNLYGINFNNLYRIDKTTAVATLVGAHGIPGANALVFESNGVLYAAGNTLNTLYTVNTATGMATALPGNTGTAFQGDLAFNGGQLYGTGLNGDLVSLNPTTGAGANVGSLGVANVFGLATANNGTTYAVAGTEIYTVNLSTGALTPDLNYGGNAANLGDANGAAFFTESGATPAAPEPASVTLLVLGSAGALAYSWRRARTLPRRTPAC